MGSTTPSSDAPPQSGRANAAPDDLSQKGALADGAASRAAANGYWSANVRLLLGLLAVWFAVSFGAGILFVAELNAFSLGGYPLGFWFAQQGAIYVFVGLIFFYSARMKRIERRFGVDDDDA